MLYMMLCTTMLWTSMCFSAPPACSAPIHAHLDSFITRHMHGNADTRERNLLSHPRDRRWRWQLRITAATCRRRLRRPLVVVGPGLLNKCGSPRATQRYHPSERGSAPGDAPGRRKLVVSRLELARHLSFVEFLVGNLRGWVVPGPLS